MSTIACLHTRTCCQPRMEQRSARLLPVPVGDSSSACCEVFSAVITLLIIAIWGACGFSPGGKCTSTPHICRTLRGPACEGNPRSLQRQSSVTSARAGGGPPPRTSAARCAAPAETTLGHFRDNPRSLQPRPLRGPAGTCNGAYFLKYWAVTGKPRLFPTYLDIRETAFEP
eukprot:3484757-Pyramimonas_sp.AAC.1